MSLQVPYAGFNYTPEYQSSGIPWVTSSIVSGVQHWQFGYVTRSVTVKNVSGSSNVRVAFTENGLATNHYFELTTGEGLSEDFRCTDLWIEATGNTVSVLAGLTNIQSNTLGFRMSGSSENPPVLGGMG